MSFEIVIKPSGVSFQSKENILDDAIGSSIHLSHSCKNGQCGECRARIQNGMVQNENNEIVSEGDILTCQSKALSDLVLDAEYISELQHIKTKITPSKVAGVAYPRADILILSLRLPPNAHFEYLSGQYLDLIYKGIKRSYSIASAFSDSNMLELHIRKAPQGKMSELLFDKIQIDELLRLEGPKGTFFLRKNTKPLIFLATGTGIAPFKAIIEDMISTQDARPVYLYWGMRTSNEIYTSVFDEYKNKKSNIYFCPVLSREINERFKSGYVQDCAIEVHKDLSQFEVYACGSKQMIDSAKSLFINHGLNEDAFYSDAFLPSI